MFIRPLHSPSQNCLIESVSLESIKNSSTDDAEKKLLLLDKDKQLILTEGLKIEVQFQINSSFSTLDSILKYSRGLQQWQPDVLYVEIRELLFHDEMEEKWKNIHDDIDVNDLVPIVVSGSAEASAQTYRSSQHPSNASSGFFSLGSITQDEDCNVVISLHVNISGSKDNVLVPGSYRLELRFFQYGGSTSSVFIPFVITSQSLDYMVQSLTGESRENSSEIQPQVSKKDIPSQKQVYKIMTTVNPSKHFIHTVQLEGHDNWTKLHFSRNHHVHFDYSKHSSSSNHGKNYSMTYSHANSGQSTRQKFSSSVCLPIQTQRKSLESIASKKFSKNGYNSKKSVILFVIGNGLDETKLPKGRVTVLRPRRVVDPLTPAQMTAVQNQTANLLSLLNNAPFCPVIFYDLNNGRSVRVVDIQFALHFVYERAQQKKDSSNVIVLCTWTFRMHQRVEALDNLFESVCSLPNVLFLSSAGNDGEDLQDSVVYPAICDSVLAIGSLDPSPDLMHPQHLQLAQTGQSSTFDSSHNNIPQTIYRLNLDTNRGDPVNFYVRAESTSYAAIYSSVVLALMWLLDTNNEQQTVKDLFLQEACSWVVCARSHERILALTRANDVIRKLMGQQDEQQIGGILIESESDDESLDEMEGETQKITIQGGVIIESVDNDSDDEDLHTNNDLDVSESGFYGASENDQILRSRNQYLHALIKRMQFVHNPIFSSVGATLDVTSDDIIDGEKIDNIAQKLQMKGNMNRVLLLGDISSGKTLRLYRLLVQICEQSLNISHNLPGKMGKLDSPLTPFYVSLAGIRRKDNIISFIKENFSSLQSTLWEHSSNRLLVIDDFQESFNYDRDIAKLSEEFDDVKIVLASTQPISNPEQELSFHIINVQAPSLEENPKEVLFGKQGSQRVPISDTDIKRYISWCKQHSPHFLESPITFSAFISSESYRKQHNLPERINSSFVSKFLQKLSSSYERNITILEDLCNQFLDSLTEDSLDSIDFPVSSNSTLASKKELLKRYLLPVLSLFAFHVLQSSSFSFSEFIDPSKGKKYSFVFEVISKNLNSCKFFSTVEGSLHRGKNKVQYCFCDPFLMKLLASNYILSTFTEKCRKKDLQSFYKTFYRQLYDPAFADCLQMLRGADSEFKKFLSLKGIDSFLNPSEESLHQSKSKKKVGDHSPNPSSTIDKITSLGTQRELDEMLHKLESCTKTETKQELILKIQESSDHYDMYFSEKVVSQFISMLSVEKDSVVQQYLLKVICRLSSQCPDSMIQVVVRSIQVIAADETSEIRGFAIHQLKHFTTYADKEQMMRFLVDLFREEKDEEIRHTILDTIGVLRSDRVSDRKSIWFELGALDEESDNENSRVRVSLLKTMSKLISSPQHWTAVLQKLRLMIRNRIISSGDAMFIYNELAASISNIDDLFAIADVITDLESGKNELLLQQAGEIPEEAELVLRVETIGNLLHVTENFQKEIALVIEKRQNPSDESLQERLLDNLFTILKNGSNRASQKVVEVMESLPNNFSQRDNILKRTAECIASGNAGQSILAKRLIRLFDKYMDRDMESDTFWSCFVKLGYIVSDYDIDHTAHDVVLNIASRRSMKEIRIMLDELVHHLHSCCDDTPHKNSLRSLIQKLYFSLRAEKMK